MRRAFSPAAFWLGEIPNAHVSFFIHPLVVLEFIQIEINAHIAINPLKGITGAIKNLEINDPLSELLPGLQSFKFLCPQNHCAAHLRVIDEYAGISNGDIIGLVEDQVHFTAQRALALEGAHGNHGNHQQNGSQREKQAARHFV